MMIDKGNEHLANTNQRGFTIIEVLIVLAIAGLILLIVFLAVPSLQRNARNTRRRHDLGRFYDLIIEKQNATPGQKAPFPGEAASDEAEYNNFVASLGSSFSPYTFPWKESAHALHEFTVSEDQIIYFGLHHCNEGTDTPPEGPENLVSGAHNTYTFSVFIGLEPSGQYYCLDND